MNFPKIAEQTIAKLGGKENITTLAHCATRLRLTLADESKVDKEATTFSERFSGYFRTNHSCYRGRRFADGYPFNANLGRLLLGRAFSYHQIP